MKRFLRLLPLFLVTMSVAGCETWKQADRGAALALAYDVDNVKVDGKPLIRLRGHHAAAWIDPVGGRVVAYRFQRRARWVFGRAPQGHDPPMVEIESQEGDNTLAGDGWRTVADPPIDAMAEQTYWVVDATAREFVLLADDVGGLRWRKVFSIDRDGTLLHIEVELRNVSGHDIETGAASLIETAGPLREVDGAQEATVDGVRLRRWRDEAEGEGFIFEKRVLRRGDRIAWREVWQLTSEPNGAAGGGE